MDYSSIVDAVRAHAAECAPRECCGLAVIVRGKLRYVPCRNDFVPREGDRDGDQFILNGYDYALAADSGEVAAVVHSHVGIPPQPTEPDLVAIEQWKLPWLIVNHPTGAWQVTLPTGYEAPLLGRTFAHGILDCYTLCRDYYNRTLGIVLPDFPRDNYWWEKAGQNLYLDHFAEAGFFEISEKELRVHDAILMQAASDRPNHAAIYVGNNQIIQHVMGRISSRDPWGGWWRKNATHFLRHKDIK